MSRKELKFSDLPSFTRVKLSEKGREEFWHRVNEFGGIKEFCEAFDLSSSTVYNWKNKDTFIPVELIRNVFDNKLVDEVIALKGKGRSSPLRNPKLPIKLDNELLTRIQTSVNVNSNGIPVYQSSDRGNTRRFMELLDQIGDIPYIFYNRSVYEVRYPKFIHKVLSDIDYRENFGALVDEKGSIQDHKLIVGDRERSFEEFEGQLFSRQKRYEYYLIKGDSEKLGELISEEASRLEKVL